MVTFKIDKHFVANNACVTANIVLDIFVLQTHIALLGIAELVINEVLNFSFQRKVEQLFNFFNVFSRHGAGIFSKFLSTYIIIRFKIFMPEKRPEAFIILHTVFSKLHLCAIVKLCINLPCKK